jgi:uracil phosphoribosyltransferase
MADLHPNLTVLTNPLAQQHMTVLRNRATDPDVFRRTTRQLATALLHEAARSFETEEVEVETPLERTTGVRIAKDLVAVAVLRAGLGLLEGITRQLPNLKVGYVGVFRDEETAQPQEYYTKLPNLDNAHVLLLEPMLATGGSLAWAVSKVKEMGGTDITALTVCAAPVGVEHMAEVHPDVRIVTAALDRGLDHNFYIRPGIGDMGDRLFGTT